MGKAKDIQVRYIGVDELTPYDKNAKKHTEEQLSAIAESIKEFGFSQPIVAWHDESGRAVVVAGHGRLKAAKRLKMDSVPVVFVDDLSDEQRRALTLADNQTTMMTGWDETALDFELTDLADVFDMERFGFAPNEEEAEEKYTSKIKGLIYEPCGVCPEVSELTDGANAAALMLEVESMDASDEIKGFLKAAACRFVRFDYEAIADWFPYQSEEIKAMMEKLALVITVPSISVAAGNLIDGIGGGYDA